MEETISLRELMQTLRKTNEINRAYYLGSRRD